MAKFTIKQNDTSPALKIQCIDSSGTAIDITNASVEFHMINDSDDTEKINSSSGTSITDASNGYVQYEWSDGDTDTVGQYKAEFQVTYDDGTIETFPNNGFITVDIHKEGA